MDQDHSHSPLSPLPSSKQISLYHWFLEIGSYYVVQPEGQLTIFLYQLKNTQAAGVLVMPDCYLLCFGWMFVVVGPEHGDLGILGKCSSTELHVQLQWGHSEIEQNAELTIFFIKDAFFLQTGEMLQPVSCLLHSMRT